MHQLSKDEKEPSIRKSNSKFMTKSTFKKKFN